MVGVTKVKVPIGHNARTREKIKTTQLINRLTKHVMTYPGKVGYEKNLMTPAQVTAALGLIRKSLPDLAIVEGVIDHTGTVKHEHSVKDELKLNFDEWRNKSEEDSDKVRH